MTQRTIFTAPLILLFSTVLHAGSVPLNAADSTAAFNRLKALAGEWEAETSRGKNHVSYEVIAGGTSVVERESSDKMPTMLTVYYLDGGTVMLTHYCMTGNQPRMRASAFNPGSGELKFDFLDATNMPNANAVHMHEVTMHLVDNQHLSTDWNLYENARSKSVESFQYSRVQ